MEAGRTGTNVGSSGQSKRDRVWRRGKTEYILILRRPLNSLGPSTQIRTDTQKFDSLPLPEDVAG